MKLRFVPLTVVALVAPVALFGLASVACENKKLPESEAGVAIANLDCRAGRSCQEEGKCTLKAGSCGVGANADCRASSRCREMGKCNFEGGGEECTVTAADCAPTSACTQYGLCTPSATKLFCEATPESCAKSPACKDRGACHVKTGEWIYCAPADDDDCKKSEGCKAKGECKLVDNQCIKG
jgi:hypothetical protein